MSSNRYTACLMRTGFVAALLFHLTQSCIAGLPLPLYPDLFPYVSADAPAGFESLQNWRRDGDLIRFNTLFANQGDGLFEIRRGADVSADRYELFQRVYLNNDFGNEFEDISIGTAPIPGTPGTPNPNDFNVIWFENFTRFSLHAAPIVDGLLTVGDEVAGHTKTSWRLSANTPEPLPEFPSDTPRYFGSSQSIEQRISAGWADIYSSFSRDQFINIAGVDSGVRYWLRQTVDPSNRIHETDETNNSFEVLIDLTQPGEAILFGDEFAQPGDPAQNGDLNRDGVVDIGDWLAFKAGANADLQGLGKAEAYLLGDLDLDGEHTISDVVLFREMFDGANGAGAFASLQNVPEPSTLLIGVAATALLVARWPRVARRGLSIAMVCFVSGTLVLAPSNTFGASLFSENFDSLTLGPNVDETLPGTNVWTNLPPAGWQIDNSGVPSGGVTEWAGWSFADPDWWSSTAGNQGRADFVKGTGVVAVADPDEWDDLPNSPGTYNTFLSTPSISLDGVIANTAQLRFDSSWRPEGLQDANITVSFDGAQPVEVLRWTSQSGTFAKGEATNETVTIPLANPAGASTMQLNFGMLNAGNNWWWAIDNIEVFEAAALQVDTDTGEMTILGAEDIAGYQITGPAGSLDPVAWRAGNLDAQDIGAATPLVGDLNHDNVVNDGDITTWEAAYQTSTAGDLDDDEDSDGSDFLSLQREVGNSLPPGGSWETLIADDNKLLEYFLLGSSDLTAQSIGNGYNTSQASSNLAFSYSNASGEEFVGAVTYVSSSSAAVAVPEPSLVVLSLLASPAWASNRIRRLMSLRRTSESD